MVFGGLCQVRIVAALTDVLELQQMALVEMATAIVWEVLGTEIARALVFPLGYLFFAVPLGEGLVPYLMDFTADFTVKALQFSGVPVYREALYFSIPSGNFEVVKACSGIRYLIASVALGTLYAYISYRSVSRRLLFIALAVLVPIVANGVRAYGIVMLAHLRNP